MKKRVAWATISMVAVLGASILIVSCVRDESRTARNVVSCTTASCHEGIEEIHPLFQLSCVDCHGGDDTKPTLNEAHVARPQSFGTYPLEANSHETNTQFLRGPRLLREGDPSNADHQDAAILAYRRFVNPGDLFVANASCGSGFPGEAGRCHGTIVDRVTRSLHATSAGLVSGAYYANGFRGRFTASFGDDRDKDAFCAAVLPGGQPIADPAFDPSISGTVQSISSGVPFDDFRARNPNPPDNAPIDANFTFGVTTSFIHTDCARCHIYTEGVKRFGEFRSSGCSACHVYYANEGRSITADRSISRVETDHPYRHEMQRYPPDEQCVHCHNRGGRHGMEFVGMRERPQGFRDTIFNDRGENNARVNDPNTAGGRRLGFFPTLPRFFLATSAALALNPPAAAGDAIHGREYAESQLWGRDTGKTDGNNFLIRDEDTSNAVDETPADVHQARGMQCVDCHTREELHGDGHIYSDRFREHEIECESCHGTPARRADSLGLVTRRGRRIHRTGPSPDARGLYADASGNVFQVFAPLQGRADSSQPRPQTVRRVVQLPDVLAPGHADFNPRAADRACGIHSDGPSSTNPAATGRGRLECFTCHSGWAMNCVSCHMIIDYGNTASGDANGDGVIETPKDFATSYLDNVSRFGIQDQQRFLTVPDHLVLGLNYESRVSPFTVSGQATLFAVSATGAQTGGSFLLQNFVSDPAAPATRTVTAFTFTTIDNGLHLPAMPLNPIFPHTVQEVPRNCDGCHPTPGLAGAERTTQLELVDKALGIGNGLRRAGGVESSAARVSTARVYDDPASGTGTVIVRPFASGPQASLTFRLRDIAIIRSGTRFFTGDRPAATDHFVTRTGANAQDGDLVDVNIDEFIILQPNATLLDEAGLAAYSVTSIRRQRPTTHRGSGPLDALAIERMLRNLVPPQARGSP